MRAINLLPREPKIEFLDRRRLTFGFSGVLILLSVVFFFWQGLNLGIDFRGGTLMEVRADRAADIGDMRRRLAGLDIGEVALQAFGAPTDVLIRVQEQEGDEKAQIKAIEAVKQALGPGFEARRVEFVGPKVGSELVEAGIMAVVLALLGIMAYIWFRFEWQFSVGAVIALVHDVVSTIGIFAFTQMEFNLSTVAAILTIAGYSINDTVVVYDRVRENLRRYKSLPLTRLLNRSINETLSRTLMTSLTTLLALLALYLFGGEVIRGFSFAMIWGVVVGTYSSICIAVPLLVYFGLPSGASEEGGDASTGVDAGHG